MDIALVLALGFAGGMAGGLLGVGGGVLFVPAIAIFLDEPQLRAEATSLAAIVPVAIAGTRRQIGYGNVRLREGVLIGSLALPGVAVGVVVANALPERALEVAFAGLLLFVAWRMLRAGLRVDPPEAAGS